MTWIDTEKGSVLNLAHCDLIEIRSSKDGKSHELVVWNAHQPMEPHVITRFDSQKKAHGALSALRAHLDGAQISYKDLK